MAEHPFWREALRTAVVALAAGGILAGCGPVAAPKPHTPTPTHVSKAGTPHKSGLYHTGKKTAKKAAKGTAGAARQGAARMGAMMRHKHWRGSWLAHTSRVKPISLATLPPLTYLKKLDPWLNRAHQISNFVTGMGYHWATPWPGIVVMTNQAGLVTGVEATFPQILGSYPWFDPPTTEPNAGVADNSEHLYFVAPSSITPSMTTTTSDLTSWSTFQSVNTRLSSYVKEPTPFFGLTVYGPPRGPGVKVLVNSSGTVTGFLVEEPAKWGYFPGYYPPRPQGPLPSREFGKAWDSVLLLNPLPKGAKP
jgi:hypothetical protein